MEHTASDARGLCRRALAGDRLGQAELDIDEGHRTEAGVLPHLSRLELRPGTVAEYRAWLAAAHERVQVFV